MYDELVKMLRTCAERDSCIGWKEACPYLGTGMCDNKAEKAADVIEELSAVNERQLLENAVLSKPRWIPVTERLPEKTGFTLIFTANGNPGVCYFTNGWWGGYSKDHITHWMPLPEPPKEGKA